MEEGELHIDRIAASRGATSHVGRLILFPQFPLIIAILGVLLFVRP